MTQPKIDEVNARGRCAGERLVELFAPSGEPPASALGWEEHRWTRLRVFLSVLDRLLRGFTGACTELDEGDTLTRPYVPLEQTPDTGTPCLSCCRRRQRRRHPKSSARRRRRCQQLTSPALTAVRTSPQLKTAFAPGSSITAAAAEVSPIVSRSR